MLRFEVEGRVALWLDLLWREEGVTRTTAVGADFSPTRLENGVLGPPEAGSRCAEDVCSSTLGGDKGPACSAALATESSTCEFDRKGALEVSSAVVWVGSGSCAKVATESFALPVLRFFFTAGNAARMEGDDPKDAEPFAPRLAEVRLDVGAVILVFFGFLFVRLRGKNASSSSEKP